MILDRHLRTDGKKPSRASVMEHVACFLADFSPSSYKDYSAEAGIDLKAAFARMDRAHEAGLIHVAGWRRGSSAPPLPLYAIGRAPDAEKPRPLTVAEIKREHYKRIKADTRKYKARLKNRREKMREHRANNSELAQKARHYGREWARKRNGYQPRIASVARRDPLLAALMGIRRPA